jgi:hypothetical protein
LKAILIIGFRADVGAYIVYSYPSFDAKGSNLDVMNIYNLHRFRTTERNFQIITQGGLNIASYYSGFKNTNYIGAPDYCVTLLLESHENPNDYEKVLIKVTNNILPKLGSNAMENLMSDTFDLLDLKDFDDITVAQEEIIDEKPIEKSAIPTVSSATISEEEKIFADLMQSEDLDTSDKDLDTKLTDFVGVGSGNDPFAGSGAADPFAANPFADSSGGAASDQFAENPFDEAQKPSLTKAFTGDEALGVQMFDKKRTTSADIVQKLDALERNKPQKPSETDKEANYKYLENLVAFLEEKVKMLGSLANSVKGLEKSHEEKDKLIGKLLLLLKGS